MMKAIFKGRIFEFDEQDDYAIEKLSTVTGYPMEKLKNLIRRVLLSTTSLSCALDTVQEQFKELSEALDEMIEKTQYEHVRIKEKPEYCTFKSRLNPYEKRRSFQRPIFWKRIRCRLFKKPP